MVHRINKKNQYLQPMPRGMKISKHMHVYYNYKINHKLVHQETQLFLRLFWSANKECIINKIDVFTYLSVQSL